MVKTVSLEVASKEWGRLVGQIGARRDRYVVVQNHHPVAVILSPDEYQMFVESQREKEHAWRELFSVMDEVHAQNARFTEEEVHRDIEEAIRAVRGRTA